MKYKIDIWKKNKETGEYKIEISFEINESNIEEFALTQYLKDNESSIDNRFEYSAQLDEIII